MTVKDKVDFRNMRAVTVATLLILLALAALLIALDLVEWYVALYVVLIGIGALLVLLSFMIPGRKSDYAGPSVMDYNLAWGVLIIAAGVAGLVHKYVSDNIFVIVFIMLLAVAAVILIMVLKSRKGE